MPNNFIPYGRQFIDDEDIKSVLSILNSEYLTQGPNIEVFENVDREEEKEMIEEAISIDIPHTNTFTCI